MKEKPLRCIILVLIIVMCFPIVFLLTGSFMSEYELKEKIGVIFATSNFRYVSWTILPEEPNIWSYIKVIVDSPEFIAAFWNTIKITVITLLLQCIINISAAWGLAMYNFKGKKLIFKLYIVFLILPFQVLMLPQYLVLEKLRLLDSIWAVIFPMVFSSQFIFVLYYYFKKTTQYIIDAAKLEGANEWQIFIFMGVPIARNGIIIAIILSIVECFNIIEQPLLFLKTKSLWPMSLYLPNAKVENIGENFVSAVIYLTPIILIYLYGQACIEDENNANN